MTDAKVVEVLEEGISFEEVPTLTNLRKMKEILDRAEMDDEVKSELLKRIREIQRDSIKHSSAFNRMLDEVSGDE